VIKTNQSGPVLWTGGEFGPEAGLIGLSAMFVGLLLTFVWLRLTRGGYELKTGLAFFTKREI
jgi:uncharacterized protein